MVDSKQVAFAILCLHLFNSLVVVGKYVVAGRPCRDLESRGVGIGFGVDEDVEPGISRLKPHAILDVGLGRRDKSEGGKQGIVSHGISFNGYGQVGFDVAENGERS